nr:hypothetical protein [uncultured bacterium]
MKYFIFFICVLSLTLCLLYFSYSNMDSSAEYGIQWFPIAVRNKNISAINFFIFVGTAFYLWKNNFFRRND